MVPTTLLKLTSSTLSLYRKPISCGKQPDKLVLNNKSSSKVSAKFAILGGRQPPNLLLANTTTEAELVPKVDGITELKRLLLTKIASRPLLKTSGGNAPSNSLKRMSRNFRVGRETTTEGKGPTNLLLLISSSNRRVRLAKVSGMIPQKRLEFRWSRARSVRRPSSSGREPAMFARLRSIPATTLILGSSRAVVQYTPL